MQRSIFIVCYATLKHWVNLSLIIIYGIWRGVGHIGKVANHWHEHYADIVFMQQDGVCLGWCLGIAAHDSHALETVLRYL